MSACHWSSDDRPNIMRPLQTAGKSVLCWRSASCPTGLVRVDLGANGQRQLPFLEINPNGRVPAIVNYEQAERPQPVFGSGAILLYLAEKTGCFLAPSGRGRIEAFEWLMWQMSGLGPMAGQAHHFRTVAPEDNAYAQQRYVSETKRLYGVMNDRLRQHSWLAGDEYSVADMACWGESGSTRCRA